MKRILFLLFFGLALAQTGNAPPEQLSDVSLSDYMEAIKAIEQTSIERVKQVQADADAAKKELYASWGDKLKQLWKDKAMKDAEKALQLEKIKQQMIDNYKAETERVYEQAVQAAKQYKEAYEAAKAHEQEVIVEKINEFKQRVNESIEAHRAQVKANLQEVDNYLKQVDQLYQKHKADSEAAVEARRQALKDKLATLFGDLQTRSSELDAQETQLKEDLKAFLQKRYEFKNDVDGAKKEVMREGLTEALEQSLEKKLDKELKELVKDEVKQKLKHPKSVLGGGLIDTSAAGSSSGSVVAPAYKATLLDTLTGASAWETVAWVLLALCILLSVALIALIAYQVSQRNKYGKLEGTDSPHRQSVVVRGNERAPLNTAPPLHYTQEKVSSPLEGPSVVTASDPLPPPPIDEHQQF